MSSSQYEREFKSILEGDQSILSRITKTCTALEKDSYFCICNKPFIVVRAAGSFGVDLVAIRGDISFLVEIKTSNEIGELASAFNQMTSDLKKSKAELEKYSVTLEKNVKESIEYLDSLIERHNKQREALVTQYEKMNAQVRMLTPVVQEKLNQMKDSSGLQS